MSGYSLSSTAVSVSNATAGGDLVASSFTWPKIIECGFLSSNAAFVNTIGFGRSSTNEVQLNPQQLTSDEGFTALSQSSIGVVWTTSPTVPSQYLRRYCSGTVLNSGSIWSFPRGLTLPPNIGYVLWNITNNGGYNFHFVIDE